MSWVAGFLLLLALNIVGNIIAQKLYPTSMDDDLGRRFAYRLVFVLSLLVVLAVVAVAGTLFGL